MTREEAIKTIRLTCPKISDSECDFETAMRFLIPELAESEDERIRKEIIDYLGLVGKGKDDYAQPMLDRWIAYLEKQKEQKVDIDKEKLIRHCIGLILTDATDERFKDYGLTLKECLTWLGEQKEQKPAEWSDNDDQLIGFIFDLLNDLVWRKDWAMSKEECLERLKFLRPQPKEEGCAYITPNKEFFQWIYDRLVYVHKENPNVDYMRSFKERIDNSVFDQCHWKPSKEQMTNLLRAEGRLRIEGESVLASKLAELYEQLKKLM